jgi:ABC-2 type transport system permease protein
MNSFADRVNLGETPHEVVALEEESRFEVLRSELRKLPAFVRRDFLTAWSYRVSFIGDIVGIVFMITVFHFVSRMVDPSKLPTYGGHRATYMEFVLIGIVVGAFIQLGLGRVMAAVRGEQLMGTLEALLMTPTAPSTIQFGSVVYDFIYIPIRTGLILLLASFVFDLHYDAAGALEAGIYLVVFIPFVWGLGVASAAGVLTIRRGGGIFALAVSALTLASGSYFPLDLLPGWVATMAKFNPIAIVLKGMREALLGHQSWGHVGPQVAFLAGLSLMSLLFGLGLFRLALRRERRKGTLGLY